jgi:hypothetical protein|tara:strand:+ start:329 stop:583 length:255 start_codon:yes stop_codon:yes gene_type:complete
MENYSHPAFTRYPHLKDKTQPQYSEWKKMFAVRPHKTIGGRTVWLQNIFIRTLTIEWTPPTYPAGAYKRTQYATWEEILNIKMR